MGQITQIELENWRCIKAGELPLAPRMLFVSDGPGPGKSSWLDAVTFALVGSCRGTGITGQGSEALRMHGSDVANVELEIQDQHGEWQLGRRVAKSGGPYMREDGGAKQSGIHVRYEESFGLPVPAMFPNVRAHDFLQMSKEDREKIVLAACGTFSVKALMEKAGDLWPGGWEHSAVVNILGQADSLSVRDGMRRISNKAQTARRDAEQDMEAAAASIQALTQAQEAAVPDVKPPTKKQLEKAQADVTTASAKREALLQQISARQQAQQHLDSMDGEEPEQSVEFLRVQHEATFGKRGAMVPKLKRARQAVATMNTGRAKADLPPVHSLEDLGEPPELTQVHFQLAEKGCGGCGWLEEMGAEGQCPHKHGSPEVLRQLKAEDEGATRAYNEAKSVLAAEAELRLELKGLEQQIELAESKLDKAKGYVRRLKAAQDALTELGEPPAEDALQTATAEQQQAQEQLSELERALGAADAGKGVKSQITAAKRKRTAATKTVAGWKALETVTDPAGELAKRWVADIGMRFVAQLPKTSALLAPSHKLPEGMKPILSSWANGECEVIRIHGTTEVGVPWRLASRGEQKFGELCVAVTWAMVTGCFVIVVDDVDALGSLLPIVLDGLYGSGTDGNVLLAGVGSTMATAIKTAETGEQWQAERVAA